jgi:hypothetical protein
MRIKKFNENINIKNFYDNFPDNRVILLIQYNMMKDNWSAWTPDSYYSYLFKLDDEEIKNFQEKEDYEIKEIYDDIENYRKKNVIT